MPRGYWLLEEKAGQYRLAKVAAGAVLVDEAVPRDDDLGELAVAVRRALDAHGYRGEPMLLALSSRTCLAATFPHSGRSMARNHQAMAFALEEFVPLAAEDMACDFIVFDDDALGVAVETAAVLPLLSSLEDAGVPIVSVVPATLLALQHQLKGTRAGRQLVLRQDGDAVDLLELIDGKPHAWKNTAATSEGLAREIRLLTMAADAETIDHVLASGLSEQLLEATCHAAGDVPVTADSRPAESTFAGATIAVLAGREEPWVELRRGGLGDYDPHRSIRGRLRFLAVATACLLLSASVAAYILASRYESIATNCWQQQEDVFRGVFPGARVPVGVQSRLESEYRALAGTRGDVEGSPQLESAAVIFRDAITVLPNDLRFRLAEIRAEAKTIYLGGEVRQHGDADRLAMALRQNHFRVDQPRTELISDKSVGLVITATRTSEEDGEKQEEVAQ